VIDPPGAFKTPSDGADWLELCVLFEDSRKVSVDEVADVLFNGGNVGTPDERPAAGEPTYGDDTDLSDDDPARMQAAELLAEVRRRKVALAEHYPINLHRDAVALRLASWKETPSFTAMVLFANLAKYEFGLTLDKVGQYTYTHLFEKVVQACARGLFRGTATRFGVPKEIGWPTGIEDRVRRMAEELGLDPERLDNKLEPGDGDRTLDIASRLSFGDDGPGTTMVWIQCAVGRHWADKLSEPIPAMIEDLLRWNAVPIRAIAIPWWFDADGIYSRWFRKFNKAMILDRRRLLTGTPVEFLDDACRQPLEDWCAAQAARLPSVV